MRSEVEAGSPIVIADPRLFMRGCLACWLSQSGRDFELRVAADAVKVVTQGEAPIPRAVVLSAPLFPEGITWLKEQAAGLRQIAPDLPIALIIDESESAAGQELALSLGFQAFIPMSSSLAVAAAALELVIVGGRYFPHLVAAGISKENGTGRPLKLCAPWRPDLTPREQAVCELLSEGLPNKLIGRKLGMALSTVKLHVHHILEKMNVRNRTEVALRVSADLPSIALESAEPPPTATQMCSRL
jgi:DNA-binding NarL/FixJ family response regulator